MGSSTGSGRDRTKPTFEEAYPEVERIVESRKGSWTYLSVMEWQDVRQECFKRLIIKWPLYDPAKAPKLEHWVNTVVSNEIHNLKRDAGGVRWQRPCVGGGKSNGKSCTYNLGGESCSYTTSGKQCAECPVFREWEQKRQAQHHIQAAVSLENHTQEVHSMPCETIDTDVIAAWLHNEVLHNAKLTPWERRVYRLLIMKHTPPAEASKVLAAEVAKRKRPPAEDEKWSYHACLAYARMFKGIMRVILWRNGYIGDQHLKPANRRR